MYRPTGFACCLLGAVMGLAVNARAGSAFSVEIDGLASWSTIAPFTDATAIFGPWQTFAGGELGAASLTLDNYPILGVQAKTDSFLRAYPGWREGAVDSRPLVNYRVTWDDGAADGASLSFLGKSLTGISSLDLGGGHTRYTATLPFQYDNASGEGSLTLRIDNTLAGIVNPVANVHMVAQQYINPQTNTAPVYREEFLRKVSPFKTLRMMDWQQTNSGTLENLPEPKPDPFTDSRVINWADRVTTSNFSRTTNKGVPWEEIITLANASKKDLWINIPDRATDDYVTNLATLLKNTLDPSVKVYVEYSNELWNTGPGAERWQRVLEDAKADPAINDGVDPTNNNRLIARQMAKQLTRFSAILKTELGASRIKPVLAGQTPNHGFLQYALDFLARRKYGPAAGSYQVGDLSDEIASIAVAPYVGNDLGANEPVRRDENGVVIGSYDANNAAERDMYLNWLFDNLTKFVAGENGQPGQLVVGVRQHKQLADTYNVKLDSYEAGQHLIAFNGLIKDQDGTPRAGDYNGELKILANKDPRMAALYQLMIDTWNAESNNGLFSQFALVSSYTNFGSWGMLEDLTQTSSAKWDWYLARIAGDANLDGLVDMTDFQALELNFGAAHTMWGQGDFNLDGKVDYADFLIFRDKFVPATPAQGAMVDGFGAAMVPEPATAGLLVIGAAMLMLGRRKSR